MPNIIKTFEWTFRNLEYLDKRRQNSCINQRRRVWFLVRIGYSPELFSYWYYSNITDTQINTLTSTDLLLFIKLISIKISQQLNYCYLTPSYSQKKHLKTHFQSQIINSYQLKILFNLFYLNKLIKKSFKITLTFM